MNEKQAILDALDKFVNQRAGLEFANYGDVASYRSEQRSITKDLHNYRELRRAVSWRDSITADSLKAAFRAYSGRLSCKVEWHQYIPETCPGNPCGSECDHRGAPYKVVLEYCTGQYFPTEYRKAACAVLASALWDNVRDDIPNEGRDGQSPGDLIRGHFRREFGRGLAARYFT